MLVFRCQQTWTVVLLRCEAFAPPQLVLSSSRPTPLTISSAEPKTVEFLFLRAFFSFRKFFVHFSYRFDWNSKKKVIMETTIELTARFQAQKWSFPFDRLSLSDCHVQILEPTFFLFFIICCHGQWSVRSRNALKKM